jgi:hypothetical protein
MSTSRQSSEPQCPERRRLLWASQPHKAVDTVDGHRWCMAKVVAKKARYPFVIDVNA